MKVRISTITKIKLFTQRNVSSSYERESLQLPVGKRDEKQTSHMHDTKRRGLAYEWIQSSPLGLNGRHRATECGDSIARRL